MWMLGIWAALSLAWAAKVDPRSVSVHPFSWQQGRAFEITVRGTGLTGAASVWVESGGPEMTVERVDPEPPLEGVPKAKTPFELARLRVAAGGRAGRFLFRLVTPNGITNALPVYVVDRPVVSEPAAVHETPEAAVPLETPTILNGRIERRGESDYYAFEAQAGQTMTVEVLSGLPSTGAPGGNANGFDPSLAIYETAGSWFDPNRLKRIAFNDEPLWVIGQGTDAYLVHKFAKSGRFLLRVEAFSGQGGPDYSYQLRVAPGTVPPSKPPSSKSWEERGYTRPLSANRLNELAQRGGLATDRKSIETYRGETFTLPATLEGAISSPGTAQRARFQLDGPQDIAIEIETPDIAPPLFNPIVRLLNEKGDEVATNIFSGRGLCTGALVKGLVAKTIVPLRDPGQYTVEVRDTTADLGEPGFRYRVQVRPQVPHIGQVRIEEDRVNLSPGEAKTMRVSFDREEDYRGAVAVTVDGLPPGVEAAAGADFEPDKDPPRNPGKRERYTPRAERAVVVFTAKAEAVATTRPHIARILVRPVADGKAGAVIATKEIPIMVVGK